MDEETEKLVERLRLDVAMFDAARENPDKEVRYALLLDTGNALRNSANRAAATITRLTAERDSAVALMKDAADRIVRDVSELPDRTSPEDFPDQLTVTVEELRGIVLAALTQQEPKS